MHLAKCCLRKNALPVEEKEAKSVFNLRQARLATSWRGRFRDTPRHFQACNFVSYVFSGQPTPPSERAISPLHTYLPICTAFILVDLCRYLLIIKYLCISNVCLIVADLSVNQLDLSGCRRNIYAEQFAIQCQCHSIPKCLLKSLSSTSTSKDLQRPCPQVAREEMSKALVPSA